MVVDHHAHWFPPAYFEFVEGRPGAPSSSRDGRGGWDYLVDEESGGAWNYDARFFDLDRNLADMDAAGVDVSLISPVVMGDVSRGDLGFAREVLDLLHGELAAAQRRRPDRIRCLAMLPLQDTGAALEVLEQTVVGLGFRGVCVTANLGGSSIAPPRLLPVWRRIEELGVPVFLHPALRSTVFEASIRPSGEGSAGGRLAEVGLGWVYDTSLAALSLILNGVLDECPGLRVVHPHTGGVIPFITGRIANALHVPRTREEYTLERSVDEYLRENFWVDFATGSSPTMLELAAQTYGRDHVLYGSDYPFSPRPVYEELLDALDPDYAATIRANQMPALEMSS